ncbi:hypothetical protein NC652_008841 [Populus alba x Populus x berolinensis]|nr:hypothetical protein NC652_008841 [Populus alba x Populus x berolinensis]
MPDHRRSLRARYPPTYHPTLDQTFVKCTIEEIINTPTTQILLERLYHIDVSSINRLQQLACAIGNERAKIEAFSAYVYMEDHETTITEQKQGSLLDVASNVHGAISKVRRHIFGFD